MILRVAIAFAVAFMVALGATAAIAAFASFQASTNGAPPPPIQSDPFPIGVL